MRVWYMCCFSCCCFCYCASVLWPSLLSSAAYSYLNIWYSWVFFCVAHETRLRSFRFLLGPPPPLSLNLIVDLYISFCLPRPAKRCCCSAVVALWSWHSISETHLLFSEFPVLFLSTALSLSLSLIYYPPLLPVFTLTKITPPAPSLSLGKWAALKIAFSVTEADIYSFPCSLCFCFQA